MATVKLSSAPYYVFDQAVIQRLPHPGRELVKFLHLGGGVVVGAITGHSKIPASF
jgi:hypothetical protein